ncbi:hypothetical protein DFH27DRAFT_580626 [Peziza echinospora]|nr:hypothetical protein DFH27DRAFT_580626 [Peziza echinospora]
MSPSPPTTTTPQTFLALLLTPGPYHILLYGTLLGSTVFQSFIAGVLAYKALPRAQFSQLQQRIFPVYFTLQTIIPPLLYLTLPPSSTSTSPTPPTLLIATTFLTGLTNLALVGPMTTRIMRERKKQETVEGKKYHDPGAKSVEMARLNRRFGMAHGVSALLNLVGLGAAVGYGVLLGGRL